MKLDKLDQNELLHAALEANGKGAHAESLGLLKTLLERNPNHALGTYLMAAEHAQIGMMDRAEEGFRRSIELDPNFPMARFQLGQLCMVKGNAAGAREALAPLTSLPASEALGAYARGLTAAANENLADAIRELQAGLACEQPIEALAGDMRRSLDNLLVLRDGGQAGPGQPAAPAAPSPNAALYLSKYGKSDE
jgi:tetratricopeptide (TPR) repeat protein